MNVLFNENIALRAIVLGNNIHFILFTSFYCYEYLYTTNNLPVKISCCKNYHKNDKYL